MGKLKRKCQVSVVDQGSSPKVHIIFIGQAYLITNYILLGLCLGLTLYYNTKDAPKRVERPGLIPNLILLSVNVVCALKLLGGVYMNKAVLLCPFMLIAAVDSMYSTYWLLSFDWTENISGLSKVGELVKGVINKVLSLFFEGQLDDLKTIVDSIPKSVYSLCTFGVFFFNVYSLVMVYTYYQDMKKTSRKIEYDSMPVDV